MKKTFVTLLLFLVASGAVSSQESSLTVPQIMQDYRTWIGAWPQSPYWMEDGKSIRFRWNPGGHFPGDSLYTASPTNPAPVQVGHAERRATESSFTNWRRGQKSYTNDFSKKVFTSDGDIFVSRTSDGRLTQLTQTVSFEGNVSFTPDDSGVYFWRDDNAFLLDLSSGSVKQLTDLRTTKKPEAREEDKTFLTAQQENLFSVIRDRQEREQLQKISREREVAAYDRPPVFYSGGSRIENEQIDPLARYATFRLSRGGDNVNTIVQDYVTESGYATDLNSRPKVGAAGTIYTAHIQHLHADTTITLDFKTLPGALTPPEYLAEQGVEEMSGKNERLFIPYGPVWSADGTYAVMDIRTYDNKDRWIVKVDPETGELTTLDHQHDEAWIGGPGVSWFGGSGVGFLPDNKHVYFQSESTGYSHLYIADVSTGEVKQLTSGEFEIMDANLSRAGTHWYFTSSEGSPFERHFYRMPVMGGTRTRLTTMEGYNDVALSPDERTMAILFSTGNRPPEVYFQRTGSANVTRVTTSPTDDWLKYPWQNPEIITIPASDGAEVPARIYRPGKPNGAAVLFVHGAGYLQNVHKGWSTYFREYMFHHLLADLGYVVLDVDYRASSGYGRDWRTAIYRHMGGRDLQDYVDASNYVGEMFNIPPERVGIYGGSYGGFITLMALFTEPEHFGAGAALRSVTDWAHYNHGYTSNILNTPETDSLAFVRSSPIYFAEGLEDPLLIAHGVVDTNVQFQDVVRLAQRLIELGKENWEMALYPVEGHGFVEPTSWTDEYSRILKLFETTIGKR